MAHSGPVQMAILLNSHVTSGLEVLSPIRCIKRIMAIMQTLLRFNIDFKHVGLGWWEGRRELTSYPKGTYQRPPLFVQRSLRDS